jgi:hypothetical protein
MAATWLAGVVSSSAPLVHADDVQRLQWKPLDPSAQTAAVEMAAAQMQGNYERIRTLKARYAIQQDEPTSQAFVAQFDKDAAKKGPLRLSATFDMDFVIDMVTGAIYRSKENSMLKWSREGSQEPVSVGHAKAINERSVVTAEHYVHFDSTNVMPELQVLPGNPKAMMKRVAFVDTTRLAEGQHQGDLPDARQFFTIGGAMPWRPLQEFNSLGGGRSPFKFYQAADAKHTSVYRLAVAMRDGTYGSIVFDPKQGMWPTSYVLSREESGARPLLSQRWQWKKCDDIYVPAQSEFSLFTGNSGECTRHRKAVLTECVLNKPIDPHQFTYQALGMKAGDIVVDNINREVLIVENEDVTKLANFGEQYIPPGENGSLPGGGSRTFTRILQMAFVGAILGLLVAVFVVRTRRRGR